MIRLTFTCFYASVFACTVFLKILRWETLRIYRSKYIYINLDLSRKFWANLVDDTKAMVKLFRWGWSSFRTKVPLVSDSPKRAAPPLTERERELISRELISTVQAKPKWIKVPHPSPTVASTSQRYLIITNGLRNSLTQVREFCLCKTIQKIENNFF